MTRRRTWLVLLGIALTAAALAPWRSRPQRDTVARTADQNVLLVTIDTLRADSLSCYGGRAATPNIDGLARAGTRYDFAHAHAVVTLPSHASILTGLYPFQHGIRDNAGFRLDRSIPTLAARLKDRGFETGAFVAAFPLHSQFGLSAGFDVYDQRFGEAAAASDFRVPERDATAVVNAARAWLDARSGRWFAWLHVFEPHAPYRPVEPFAGRYSADPYAGEVAAVDAALGPLFDWLRERAGRRTLVILTGDHGEALGDHGEQTHGLFAYESTLRVPLVIAQIGGLDPRRAPDDVSDRAARHVDLVPTVLDALQLPPVGGLPGRSLLQAAEPNLPSYFEALSASLNRGWAPLTGVLVDRNKFIDLPLPELYDLAADSTEQHNLAGGNEQLARALQSRLRQFDSRSAETRQEEDPETLARLRSLGYVTGTVSTRHRHTADDDPKRLVEVDRAIHDAISLYEEGRPDEAAAIYRRLIASRPRMTLAYKHLAFVEWETGRRDEAIATLRRAITAGAADTETSAKLGAYLSDLGRSVEALPLLERAAADNPGNVDTLNLLAIGSARAGRPAQAAAIFRRIVAIDPQNVIAWQNIGAVELQAGRLSTAREALQRAVAADPEWAPAYTGLGAVALRMGDRSGALEYWKRAIALDPENCDALFNLGTELVNAGRVDEARPHLERFVAIAPPADYAADIRRIATLLQRLSRAAPQAR